ncbi:MAG: hypothetical protein IAE82_05370 [Opitutaceae bacterium]|nr:hypothetical protein [Opitutaceae bacterium]
MPLVTPPQVLDESTIAADELSLGTLMREINLRERPMWVLRVLMQALDKKRQARGLGWSRPWNKIGMTVFRTHRHVVATDGAELHGAMEAIRDFAPEPLLTLPFIEDMFGDPELMAFTFYHNRESGGAQYEGLTVSFGRHVRDDRSKRDRIDLILEDRRVDGRVDGHVDLVRIIVCPWSTYGIDRDHQRFEQCEFSDDERVRFDALYHGCVATYHAWKDDESRQWSHWSADCIDYFGARAFIPAGTSFT